MNNILAVNTLSYHGHSLDRALKGVADCGIDYIEITAVPDWSEHAVPEEMSSEDVKSLRSKIQGFGLSVLSVSGHLDMAEPDIIDNHSVRRSRQVNVRLIEVNQALGGIVLDGGLVSTSFLVSEEMLRYPERVICPHVGVAGTPPFSAKLLQGVTRSEIAQCVRVLA